MILLYNEAKILVHASLWPLEDQSKYTNNKKFNIEFIHSFSSNGI